MHTLLVHTLAVLLQPLYAESFYRILWPLVSLSLVTSTQRLSTRVFKNQNPKPAFSKPEPGLKSQIRPIHLAISKVKIWKGVRSAV